MAESFALAAENRRHLSAAEPLFRALGLPAAETMWQIVEATCQ